MCAKFNETILGYEVGEIQAKAAFTTEINIAGTGVPLQGLINEQYLGSQAMDKRPGMYLKYLPYRFDAVTGQILTGGAYLFDTREDADGYEHWTSEEFEVGEPKTKFWSQPLFESVSRWTWDVIGAVNFAPLEEHAVGRFQRWKCTNANAEAALREAYPDLKAAAKAQGAVSFWLLYHPKEKMIAIQLGFAKVKGDSLASARSSLEAVERQPSLGHHFPATLDAQVLLDRASLFLALWLPKSRAAGGSERSIPNYPVVPSITH